MTRNPAAQTAFGPMVLSAVEQNEPAEHRLVDDDLADLFLPRPLRWLVSATRPAGIRRLFIRWSEWSGSGLWVNLTCRKRFIGDKLGEALDDVDAVAILGAGLDTRAYRLTRKVRIPIFEVDLPVNIARKAKTVRRVLGELPLSVRLVALDFEHDDLLTALAEHGYLTDFRVFCSSARASPNTSPKRPSGGPWRGCARRHRAAAWCSPTSAATSSTEPIATAPGPCTARCANGVNCGISACCPTRSPSFLPNTAGGWWNRRGPTSSSSAMSSRPAASSTHLRSNGRPTPKNSEPGRKRPVLRLR